MWREWTQYSADDILRKVGDFTPDIISIYWVSRFLTSKTIRELYEKTGALINLVFIDQVHMTGGCHYPSDCNGYMKKCEECPALTIGKRIAYHQFENKKKNFKNLPICITGTPADIQQAKKSVLFHNVQYHIPLISVPDVLKCDKESCRQRLGYKENDFIVLIGASGLTNRRKGITYSIEAVKKVAQKVHHIYLVCIGRDEIKDIFPSNVTVKQLGFLAKQEYYEVMTAADCFLSTTIADSGPMMVNHAIAVGTPVVSFNIGIAQTLVKHKETGYIAEFKNSASVAEGILYVYNTLSDNNHYFAEKCKTMINHLSKQKNVYEQLYNIYNEYKQSSEINDTI